MSEKLKEFDFASSSPRRTDGSYTYPWDDWFDGDIWRLDQGVDFPGHPLMMERIIRTRATNREAKVKLRHIDSDVICSKCGQPGPGSLVIQRYDIIGPSEAKKAATKAKRAATREAKVETSNGDAAPINGNKTKLVHAHRVVKKRPAKV
jgi:hypothetical protein